MVRSLHILLTALLLSASVPAGARPAERTDADSLARTLDGLAPGPRIAYLTYLLDSRKDDPEVLFHLGAAFHEGGQTDSAMHYYEKAVAVSPLLSKAYVNMGVVLDGQGRRREAIRMFVKAAEANPNDLLAHAHAAFALFAEGEYEAADAQLSRAMAIDSLHPQPHYYLAIFFWESGMFRESLVEWEKVVSLAPGSDMAERATRNIAILQQHLLAPSGERVSPPGP